MKKKISKIKGVTLDDLAMMTQRGFTEINEKFSEVDKRFNEVNERFNKMDQRFDSVDQRLNFIENKLLTAHTAEIEHLRDKFIQLEVRFAKFSK